MDKKAILARCLFAGRVLAPLSKIRGAYRADVPILAYHRVYDVREEDAFPFDIALISASTVDFRWQMEHLKENYDPITFEMLLQILEGELSSPPKPVIITFDDGFEDNFQNAFPILNALDIPATIFLATGYIGGEQTFWYDRLAHLMLRAPAQELTIEGLPGPVSVAGSIDARRQTIHSVLSELKVMPNELRLTVISELERQLGFAQDGIVSTESRPLNWNQVREMANCGIEFGSHSVTHPILASLNDKDLDFELVKSRRDIESQIGKPVHAISYPVGGRTAFNDRVRSAAQRAGYRLGISYLPGTNPLSNLDRYGLLRQHVERYTDHAYFAAMLGLPEVFQ